MRTKPWAGFNARSLKLLGLAFVCGWLTGGLLVAQPADPPSSQSLPKVRVGADRRTFITEDSKPFVPFGVTYYRPGTGWAPQLWKQFDPEATRKDFARMKAHGINCVRVFLTFKSFYTDPGQLRPEGLAKFDQMLALSQEAGIYLHPTGPDHWEGPPNWEPVAVEDPQTVGALESFWKLFAAHYRGCTTIFAYDLRNEPEVGWTGRMNPQWNAWLQRKYGNAEKLKTAWNEANEIHFGSISNPAPKDALMSRELLDFQSFREDLADEWARRQAAAIKSADPNSLVTVGLIQWSVPSLLPAGPRHYSGFRPERQARYLDFLEVHFYPLARGAYDYQSKQDETANLAYLESIIREVARPGKPVLLAEFGWYGGGKPRFDHGAHPPATEEQQADYCQAVLQTSAGMVGGWLNWGFYDQPEATDCSELTGLLKADGTPKAWGKAFQGLSEHYRGKPITAPAIGTRPELDWDACVTSAKAGDEFRRKYLEAFVKERRLNAREE